MDAERAGLLRLHPFGTFLIPSATEGHMHAFVRLKYPMPLIRRLAWQSWLGSDFMRSRADFMRFGRDIEFPSLLEETSPILGFYREPDRMCACDGKHSSEDQASRLPKDRCSTWLELRGLSVWDLFGKWDKPEKLPRLPMSQHGRVDLDKWRKIRADAAKRAADAAKKKAKDDKELGV
jgi:hypothetical protein